MSLGTCNDELLFGIAASFLSQLERISARLIMYLNAIMAQR
jgi:hypothetical protein